jgi:fructose/tagatose bisphosphate aldolase
MEFASMETMERDLEGVADWQEGFRLHDPAKITGEDLDKLTWTAVFGATPELRKTASWVIHMTGLKAGIWPASIHELYEARGRREFHGFTVPAINIRGMTYDAARAIFRAANSLDVGALIFEIARSEVGYTDQRPLEYGTVVMAAAIKEGFRGPLFVQGDHFQVNAKKYAADPTAEIDAVKSLIEEALRACFFNIDIDTSTLVDLSKPTTMEQQRANFENAALLTAHVRAHEPPGITVSVGGEIGEVGGKNSTVEELEAFMEGYAKALRSKGKNLKGISKISVQTGTSHGGVPLPDGTIATVKLDFEILEKLSRIALEKYGLAGAVQHGASTLPDEAFHHFPRTETCEIHLATGFQNIIYDCTSFPEELRGQVYDHLRETCASERKEGESDAQFIYKTRKKGFGPFKKQMWNLPLEIRRAIGGELEAKFRFLFEKLNVRGTKDLVSQKIAHAKFEMPKP